MDSGGAALKRAIHVAREKQGIPSDMQLAQRAHVSYDTLMNWYADRTVPRPAELKKVADVAGTTLVALMDAYEGREPEPPTLVDAIAQLVAELRESRSQQDAATVVLLQALGAIAGQGRPAPQGTQPDSGPDSRSTKAPQSPRGDVAGAGR